VTERRILEDQKVRKRQYILSVSEYERLKPNTLHKRDIVYLSTRYLLTRLREFISLVTNVKPADVEFYYEAIIEILYALES